jgi:hypothetical protein
VQAKLGNIWITSLIIHRQEADLVTWLNSYFKKKIKILFLLKKFMFLYGFNVLILKIIFKNKKNTLNPNYYYNLKNIRVLFRYIMNLSSFD